MVVLGIDVAKAKLDAALWLPDAGRWRMHQTRNDATGCAELLRWVQRKAGVAPDAVRVVMEATGVYHERAAQAFFAAGCTVLVANPKRVHDFARGLGSLNKNDRADAKALVRYGEQRNEHEAPWQPLPPEIQALRALLKRLEAIDKDLQREKNRWEKVEASQAPEVVRASLQRGIASLQAEHKRLCAAIKDHHHQHPGLKIERKLLQTVPGVGPVTADHLLCLLHGHAFARGARQAAALSGLVPLEYTSGSSVHGRPRLSRQGGRRLRSTLYMASIVALKYNPSLRAIYDRLIASGKAKKAALCALMRHLVHIAYGILKHQAPFNPALVSKTA